MKKSYSISEIRKADREKVASGTSSIVLMKRAARTLADVTLKEMSALAVDEVLFVCGGGNNGGDGFAAAQMLLEAGKEAFVLCLSEKFSPDCAAMKAGFRGEVFERIPRRRFSLIVDCVLGTGLSRAPEGNSAALIEYINGSGAYVIACDLPSGLSENGIAFTPCVVANKTLTIGGMKNALLMAEGADVAGEILSVDIGLSPSSGTEVWEDSDVLKYFPKRKSHVNKGTFGSACILADPVESSGAAFLAAAACLKSGAGYTRLYTQEPVYTQMIGKLPAVILKSADSQKDVFASDAIAFGMGVGVSEHVYSQLKKLILEYEGILVLDADALNSLGRYGLSILKKKKCRLIITPHPKEFARLIGEMVMDVLENAVEYAKEFAQEYGVTVALKNNRTLITDGIRTAINTTGSPLLAKGGSGDVLSGFLAGTCARGVDPFEATCVASYILGRAGELAAKEMGEYSPDATDIISYFSRAILSLNK